MVVILVKSLGMKEQCASMVLPRIHNSCVVADRTWKRGREFPNTTVAPEQSRFTPSACFARGADERKTYCGLELLY